MLAFQILPAPGVGAGVVRATGDLEAALACMLPPGRPLWLEMDGIDGIVVKLLLAALVMLGGARVFVPGRILHQMQRRFAFQRQRDERRPQIVRRQWAGHPQRAAPHALDRIL